MASGNDHDISQLNSLIEATLDSAKGYQDAASEAKASRFSTLFRQRAAQRHDNAKRLQARVKAHGGDPEKSGTTLGTVKRWFDGLQQKMTGDDVSIIAAVETGEDHIKEVYQKVMTDKELSDPVRTAVESEFVQIETNHDEMRDLKHATSPSTV
jgi:uncharacterized protein (TIGR02284 family)